MLVPELRAQSPMRSWEIRQAHYQSVLADDASFVVIAHADTQDIAYAVVGMHPGPDDTWVTGARIAEVETLVVLPDWRGTGVGTAVLDRVDTELARRGISDLRIAVLPENFEALAFYQSRGLRPFLVTLARGFTPSPQN
jgi:GNAT superfamily N-acetyltransferase